MTIKNLFIDFIFRSSIHFLSSKKTLTKNKKDCGICSLLCHRHVDMYIFTISSFFYMTKKTLPLYVVNDGSLTKKDIAKLRKYFTITIANQTSTIPKIKKRLKDYQFIQKFRFDKDTTNLKIKFDAILTNPFSKFIYIDADILFFKKPKEIVEWIDSSENICFYTAHNPYPTDYFGLKDKTLGHSFRSVLFELKSLKIDPTFSSGLLCFANSKDFDLKNVNSAIKHFYVLFYAYDVLAEETSMAFALDQKKTNFLSPKKYLNVWCYEEYIRNFTNQNISVHYSGSMKDAKFKSDAIKLAYKNHFFRNN